MNHAFFHTLVQNAKSCKICEEYLSLGPRSVFSIHAERKILVIGQALGTKVHATGILWYGLSGNELRRWLDVDRD